MKLNYFIINILFIFKMNVNTIFGLANTFQKVHCINRNIQRHQEHLLFSLHMWAFLEYDKITLLSSIFHPCVGRKNINGSHILFLLFTLSPINPLPTKQDKINIFLLISFLSLPFLLISLQPNTL